MPAAKLGLTPIKGITKAISKQLGKISGKVSVKTMSDAVKTLSKRQKIVLKAFFEANPTLVRALKLAVSTIDEAITAHRAAIAA